jgi:hypothetical protein
MDAIPSEPKPDSGYANSYKRKPIACVESRDYFEPCEAGAAGAFDGDELPPLCPAAGTLPEDATPPAGAGAPPTACCKCAVVKPFWNVLVMTRLAMA